MCKESISEKNTSIGVIPQVPWRICKVYPMPDYCLHVRFVDGLEGIVKFLPEHLTGIFVALKDRVFFEKVYLEYGAVTWPGELDLAPDAMYEEIKKNGEWVLA